MSSDRYRGQVLRKTGEPFPSFACFPILKAAIDEAENNIQAPRSLIFFGALATIAIGVQGLFDVRKPNGQCVPTSLMLLSIADSGERKSTAENNFFGAIRDFQKRKGLEYQSELKEWESNSKIWDVKYKVRLKEIAKLTRDEECSEDAERRLIEHGKARPSKPKQLKILYEDSTSEALFLGIHQNFPSAGLVSSEGGGVLNGRALTDLSKHNAIWSGDSITVDRKTAESYEVVGARLTVSIMSQRSAFDEYIKRAGEKSRGSGLWARFLVCNPRSTQGTRFLKNETVSWGCRNKFSARLAEFLELSSDLLEVSCRKRKIISFSPEAGEMWLDVYNAIESNIKVEGRFHQMGDHASKLADNIARVAALLHCFEGFGGSVSCDTLKFAVDFCLWCSDEFYYLFLPKTEEELDAMALEEWLLLDRERSDCRLSRNRILQYGPNKLRGKKRLDKALERLHMQNRVRFFSGNGTQYVELCKTF
ncbi:YfjI family protein [Pseudomonas sp. RTC3]|uniref:YfjI family protein n=1 Tax=Pseudomonas sp. 5C2 TaxID=3048588 RepID=UPI002AB5B6A7|nr:YfjI family protein [Pseudomonas sp. 5C2]MDY7566651.1 YfjI family protein [Pseudomonas sp. 5C2]MEB0061574.1 YfjI family protein [Pseudomonas sp. RTC3]MEB0240624.1 YfjI family protein [Pseudomonas sp. 5C2]